MIRNLDKRLRFLDKIINNSKVIDTTKISHDRVNFGSEIKLLNLESNEEYNYILVGTFETNPKENKISNKSPLGRALFGKRINEEFEFQINGNFFEYEVVNIKMYEFK